MDCQLISVIIPVYNVEEYLPRCLDSILRQTYRELEIICVNDGSPDGCLSILESYAREDPRIKVIDQENQGVSAARNKGLKAAMGELIAFIDSDDWIHSRYFELLTDCLARTGADVVFCEAVKVYDDEKPEPPLTGAAFRQISLTEAFSLWTVRHCSTARLYRRECLCGRGFAEEISFGEDTMFNLDVLCHITDPKLYYITEALYYWFMRSDSITHSPTPGGVFGEAEWYFRHMDREEITGSEWIMLEQAIKAAFSARYSAMFSQNAEIYGRKSTEFLKLFIPTLWKSKYAPLEKKLLLDVMYRFPWLYRAFRLAGDPTLLQWEKTVRKKQKI